MKGQLLSAFMLCVIVWIITRGNGFVDESWQVVTVGQKRGVRGLYLWWNLGLALVPWLIALGWKYLFRGLPLLLQVFIGLGWLVFLPNGPYLLTDLVHWKGAGYWGDWLLFLIFGWTGLLFSFVSISIVEGIVSHFFSHSVRWGFRVVVFSLTGFGVFLGRIFRWNTWDLYLAPRAILSDIETVLLSGQETSWILPMSLFLGAFLLTLYSFFISPKSKTNES